MNSESVVDDNRTNVLKMREALEKLCGWFSDEHRQESTTEISAILKNAKEALSSPLRNCDMFTSEYDAWKWWREKYVSSIPIDEDYLSLEDWLFANVKEEDDGNN